MCADGYMRSIHPKIKEQQLTLNIYNRKPSIATHARKEKRNGRLHILKWAEKVDEKNMQLLEKPLSCQTNNTFLSKDLCQSDDTEKFSEWHTKVAQQSDIKDCIIKDYEKACKLYNVLPFTCVKYGLVQQNLTCKSFQLQDNDCRALCNALLNNPYVERLNFRENGMGPDPAFVFAEVIQQSSFLTHIRLADNHLGSKGSKIICKVVSVNPKIVCLDLSGNGLVESDGRYIRMLIEDSNTLRELYLARNQLMNVGVRHIVAGLGGTTTLRTLDLSWNHIRLQGASAICKALENNSSLQIVNLAWNGLHKNGAKRLSTALKNNTMLKELDITCNRLTEWCVAEILQGLKKNTTLEVLRMGLNNTSPAAAFTILQTIYDNKASSIKRLDLGNQAVYDKFEELYKDIKAERDITVLYGPILNSDNASFAERQERDTELVLLSCDPLTVLMECMRLQGMRMLDFFKWLDLDKDNNICINELCEGMVKIGVPFRRQTLLRLLHRLDLDKNNLLDFREMTAALNTHRENVRKELAENAHIDLEKTEIGKITGIIKKLLDKNAALRKADHHARTKLRRHTISTALSMSLSLLKRDETHTFTKNKNGSLIHVLGDVPEITDETSDENGTQDKPRRKTMPDVLEGTEVNASEKTEFSQISSSLRRDHNAKPKLRKQPTFSLLSSEPSPSILPPVSNKIRQASNTSPLEVKNRLRDITSIVKSPDESPNIEAEKGMLISVYKNGNIQQKSEKLPAIDTNQAIQASSRSWKSRF